MATYILLILSGVLLNAAAQLLLKKGMLGIGFFEFSAANLVPISIKAAANPFIVAGLFCYVFSVGLWMMVLSRVEVSFAYPFLSIGYVVIALVGYYYFGEKLDPYRITGIALICLGVVFISRSY
jgi:multidrug transporter EmrE-like cation transporter